MLSPKIEVINHFDKLIQRVDIDIEECLKKYNEEQTIGELNFQTSTNRFQLLYFYEELKICENLWLKSTKVVDYLKQIRMRTIEELRKLKNETLEYLKLNSLDLDIIAENQRSEEEKLDEVKSQLFKDKFHFQLLYKRNQKESLFSLFTIVTDFYMSPTDIFIFEKALKAQVNDKQPFGADFKLILDEKMVLIGLIQTIFFKNFQSSNLIRVTKQVILKFHTINSIWQFNRVDLSSSNIDLSNIEKINLHSHFECEEVKIENFPFVKSLELTFQKSNRILIQNLIALKELTLTLKSPTTSDITDLRFDNLPNVETLTLSGNFSNLYLNKLVNLRRISLSGNLIDGFNYDLFKSLCNQLTELTIYCENIDDETIFKLIDDCHFPNLSILNIWSSKITSLDKKIFSAFPTIKCLSFCLNSKLRRVDNETFLSLIQLTELNLSFNCFIESIDKQLFSTLTQLETLRLNSNGIKRIEENAFVNLKNLRTLNLSNNELENLSEQSFLGLRNLKDLNLSSNKLRYFDQQSISNIFDRILKIDLNSNPMTTKKNTNNKNKKLFEKNLKFNF